MKPGENTTAQIIGVLILSVAAMVTLALGMGGPDTYDPASPNYAPDRHTCGLECQTNAPSRRDRERAAWEDSR